MKYRLEIPPGPYGTIVADPPWQYSIGGGQRKLTYDSMTLDDIKAMPVPDICTPDAHLWLWTTNPHLPEALEVVKAWGFEYKTLMTWTKSKLGLGWWLRSQTEHIIFAAKSKRLRKQPDKISTALGAYYRGHSVKPQRELAHVVELLSPGPYIEFFARHDDGRPDWTYMVSNAAPRGDPFGRGD